MDDRRNPWENKKFERRKRGGNFVEIRPIRNFCRWVSFLHFDIREDANGRFNIFERPSLFFGERLLSITPVDNVDTEGRIVEELVIEPFVVGRERGKLLIELDYLLLNRFEYKKPS